MTKGIRKVTKQNPPEKILKVGRPPKMSRQISITSNKVIDRALELMVLQGLAKSKEKAASQLLNSAANKFIKNNLRLVAALSLDNILEASEADLENSKD